MLVEFIFFKVVVWFELKLIIGFLVLCFNVVGDNVIINGKDYGVICLDFDLKFGIYKVIISKFGY